MRESVSSTYHCKFMKKELKVCNWLLLIVVAIVTASAIILECLHGSSFLGFSFSSWILMHTVVSTAMLCLVIWHVKLNWSGVRHWYSRFIHSKSKVMKLTCIFFLLTITTGLIAVPHWISSGHSGIGGFHGKLGLVALLFMVAHVIKHIRWYAQKG